MCVKSVYDSRHTSRYNCSREVYSISHCIAGAHLNRNLVLLLQLHELNAERNNKAIYIGTCDILAGCKPQEARAILPLDCNTELVHTAFISDWKHFFDLRALGTTGAPHPDAKILALPLMEEFKQKGYL